MPTYEALVLVVDPKDFIKEAYGKRNSLFKQATVIEDAGVEGRRTVSSPGRVMAIRSQDRLNVEDVLLVDLDMNEEEANVFIKVVRLPGDEG